VFICHASNSREAIRQGISLKLPPLAPHRNTPQVTTPQIKTKQIKINSREIDAILQNIIDLLRILLYN
jgi:hypothetical protein